jgi:hypothetical protein
LLVGGLGVSHPLGRHDYLMKSRRIGREALRDRDSTIEKKQAPQMGKSNDVHGKPWAGLFRVD